MSTSTGIPVEIPEGETIIEALGERIFSGEKIEVVFQDGLKVDVGDEHQVEAREVLVTATKRGTEVKLRLHRRHGNVGEYQDFFLTNPTLYLMIKNNPEQEV